MRKIMAAASIAALIIIASVTLPTFAGERSPWHAVAYPLSLALFIPYVYLTLPAIMDDRRGMTALYSLFVFLAIILIFAISELSGRGSGRMRLLVLEGALLCMMALSFASFLISLGITSTVILTAPLMAAAMIYIMAAVVDIVPPEGVGVAQAAGNAGQAPIPSYPAEAVVDIAAEEIHEEETEELQAMVIEADECLSSIPAIVVPDEAIPETAMPIVLPEGESMEAAGISSQPEISEDETVAAIYAEAEEYRTEVDGISMEISSYETVPAAAGDIDEACEEVAAITFSDDSSADSEPAVALSDDIAFESVEAETAEDTAEGEEISAISSQASYDDVIIAASQIEDESASEPVQTPAESVAPEYEAVEASAIEEEVPPADAETEVTGYSVPEPPVLYSSATLSVPAAPVLSNTAKLEGPVVPAVPVLTNRAELEEEIYQPVRSDIYDDEFWSTFYIAGQDTLQLEDGEYFMDLLINGSYVGIISTFVKDGKASLNASELSSYLADTLTDAAKDRIFIDNRRYISLESLEESGVETSFNTDTYEIELVFNPTDMPVQILSIRGVSRRAASRPITGAIDLEPVTFMWGARYQLTASLNDVTAPDLQDQLSFSLYSSNFTRLFDVHLDFSYYLDFDFSDIDFRIGSYKFYMDFPDDMIRVTWGEISSNLLSPSGQTLGIRFDKSLAYAGNWNRTTASHVEQLILIEKTSEIEIFNEGQSIYKRTLEPGSYQLRDFILYTGANRILIRITPVDGSPAREIEFDVMYSGSLLAPGEMYYGASFAFSRNVVSAGREKNSKVLSIPLWGGRRIDYDWRNVVLSGYIRSGLSEAFTLDATLALQNDSDVDIDWRPNISFAAELTQASSLGTTRYNLNVDEESDANARFTIPVFDFSIGHQITTDIAGLSTISIGASYTTPEDWDFNNENQLSANLGMSGSFGRFGWSLSGYGTVDFSDFDDYTWSVSAGISLTASRNVYLSASINLYDNRWINPTVNGRIGATIRFRSADISANTGFDDISLRASYSDSRNSFSTAIRSYDPLDIHRYDWNASYTYSGDYVSAGVNVNSFDTFSRVGLSANVATSTLFADGLFAFSSYIPSNFLLIRQYGALKGNDISIGSPGSSSFELVPSTFGTSLYTSIPVYSDRSLMVYSTGDDQFDATKSVAINLRSSSRDGYVLKLSSEETYSVSGIVMDPDGNLCRNMASPLYKISMDESGIMQMDQLDAYVFTDSDGRFVMSGLQPGMYGFDVQNGAGWILAVFTVDEGGYPDLQLLGTPVTNNECSLPSPYTAMIQFHHERNVTADEFFAILYPEIPEVAV